MTHDELLSKIDQSNSIWWSNVRFVTKETSALRAIVQLHAASPEGRYEKPICTECSFTETGHYVFYPCRNIQAIEKELK